MIATKTLNNINHSSKHLYLRGVDTGNEYICLSASFETATLYLLDSAGKISAFTSKFDGRQFAKFGLGDFLSRLILEFTPRSKNLNGLVGFVQNLINGNQSQSQTQYFDPSLFKHELFGEFIKDENIYNVLTQLLSFKRGRDTKSRSDAQRLFHYIDEQAVAVLKSFHHQSQSYEAYLILARQTPAMRAVRDLLLRHPWLTKTFVLQDIVTSVSTIDYNIHPDKIVLNILKHQSVNFKGHVNLRSNWNRIANGSITQYGISSIASWGSEASSDKRISDYLQVAELFSVLPKSWVHNWKNESNFQFLTNLSSLISMGILNDEFISKQLLKPYGGDICEIKKYMMAYSTNERSSEGKAKAVDGCDNVLSAIKDFISALNRDLIEPLCRQVGIFGTNIPYLLIIQRLLGASSLTKLHEASIEWHRVSDEIRINQQTTYSNFDWSPLADKFTASNGVELKFLTSHLELINEGLHGVDADGNRGLYHCVASYLDKCQIGKTHIASLRMPNGLKFERLSTLEVSLNVDSTVSLRQNRGRSNGHVPEAALSALSEWIAAVKSGQIEINRQMFPVDMIDRQVVRKKRTPLNELNLLQRNLSAWTPLLKQSYRNVDANSLIAEFRALLSDKVSIPINPIEQDAIDADLMARHESLVEIEMRAINLQHQFPRFMMF